MVTSVRHPVEIPIPAHLYDHRIMGEPVLPAAHALSLLADIVQQKAGIKGAFTRQAQFIRFISLTKEAAPVAAFVEFNQAEEKDALQALLLTKIQGKSSKMSRIKKHMDVCFSPLPEDASLPAEMSRIETDQAFQLNSEALYRELVPFGPAFQNCVGPLTLCPEGASAEIHVSPRSVPEGGMGSPFVFDAALHAANAWGQRYAGMVVFPVGYAERYVLLPTQAGEDYLCQACPSGGDEKELHFDIQIWDKQGCLREAVFGVKMRNIFARRLKPPAWIAA